MAKKALKSKWFRIAVEGDTTDGRDIDAKWLEEAAKTYNPAKYGARLNCEHIVGLSPDGPFGALGDVLELKTENIEVDGEQKLALFARVAPNEDGLALSNKGKKVYPSMELDLDFAKSGQAYLVGLAMTDTPASLSTEMMKFAAGANVNPFKDKKQRPENLFSAAVHGVELEFEDSTSIVEKVKAMFSKSEEAQSEQHSDVTAAIEEIAKVVANLQEKFSTLKPDGADHTEQLEKLSTDLKQAQAKISDLETTLDKTPNFTQRPPASGGKGELVTDC